MWGLSSPESGDYTRSLLTAPHTRILHGRSVFSKIDLVKAYHKIPVAEKEVHETAITTPFGLYEYVYMPFRYVMQARHFNDLSIMFCRG